jgi:phosphate transport system substrate-binding protein
MRFPATFAAPVFAAILASALAAACGGGSGSGSKSAGGELIAIDGSSTVFPLTEAIAERFMKANSGARITVGEAGTSAGMARFCRSEAVIANASRPISSGEIDNCAKANITYLELPVAYDGLTVVVHPKNTWATSMTVAELKKLWSPEAEGKILRWNQIRPGWPDREVHLFGAGVASGTFDYFNEVINGNAKQSRGDYTSSEDDNVLVQGVSSDELALGYFGLAYYESNKSKLKPVGIDDEKADNGAGPVLPSFDTVRGGTYRPLSRPLFIYVNAAAMARPEVQQFVDFYLKTDAGVISEVGYVALTDGERQLVQQRLASKTTGTMFGTGSPQMTLEGRLKGLR